MPTAHIKKTDNRARKSESISIRKRAHCGRLAHTIKKKRIPVADVCFFLQDLFLSHVLQLAAATHHIIV